MRLMLLILGLWLAGLSPAWAVRPDEMLHDPVLEARARAISQEIRCLVCQNEPIDSSNADLAHDLRVLVRERLVAGDSNEQVKAYLVARYGDFVLFDPPMKLETLVLWFGPALIVLFGGAGVAAYYLRRRRAPGAGPVPLSAAERQRLERALAEADAAESRPR